MYNGSAPPPDNLLRDAELDFANWQRLWPTYTSIRYVAASGAELVKIEAVWKDFTLKSLGPAKVLASNLTGTSEFELAMNLKLDEVFLDDSHSAVDYGVNESELLYAYTAVYAHDLNVTASVATVDDMEDGSEPLGYVAVSMRDARLWDALAAAMSVGHGVEYLVLDQNGRYLAGSQENEDHLRATQYHLADGNPELWERMSSTAANNATEPISIDVDRNGVVAFVEVPPCSIFDNPYVALATCKSSGLYYIVVTASSSFVASQQTWTVWPLVMGGLAVLLWLGVAVTFTRSNAAAEALLRNSVSVEQFRSRNKELFLATMCHELRSPLNVIVGAISLMEGPDLPDIKLPILKLMEGSADMLMAIVNDVLDISRIEAGHMELDPQPCDLRKSLESCADVHASVALRKGLNVYMTYDQHVPEICVLDFPRLRQVVSNLLSNAVKFTSAGHIEVTVRTLSGPPSSSSSRRRRSVAAVGHEPASEGQKRKAKSRSRREGRCLKARQWLSFGRGSGSGGRSSNAGSKLGSGNGGCRGSACVAGSSVTASGAAALRQHMAPSFSAVRDSEASDASATVDDLVDLERGEERGRPESSSHSATANMVWLEISVTDTGKGIAEERQAKMFDPYTQEDIGSTRQFGGTGLGLAISKRLVELWGGTITLVSAVDLGATFSVTVPVALSQPSQPSPPSPGQLQDPQPSQQEQQSVAAAALPQALPLPLPLATPESAPLTLAVANGMCAAHAEALEEGTSRAGHRLRRFPTYELLVKATALEAVGMGKRASLIGEAGSHVSAIAIDSEMVPEGLPRTVQLLREAHPSFGLVVLLGSKWASLLGHSDLAGCFIISMPVTANKVKAVLLQMAAGGTSVEGADSSGIPLRPAECLRSCSCSSSSNCYRRAPDIPLLRCGGAGSADSADFAAGGASTSGVAVSEASAIRRSKRTLSGAAPGPFASSTAGSLSMAGEGSGRCVVMATAAAAQPQPPPLRALVVDDVSANRRILQHMLELQGVIADAAADGFEALAMEREANPPYDLIYMDLHMPGKDGVEATQAIRLRHAEVAAKAAANSGGGGSSGSEAVRLKRPHMVMLTAAALSSDRERCLAAGADTFLSKPVTRKRLAESVAECQSALQRASRIAGDK